MVVIKRKVCELRNSATCQKAVAAIAYARVGGGEALKWYGRSAHFWAAETAAGTRGMRGVIFDDKTRLCCAAVSASGVAFPLKWHYGAPKQ